MQASDRSPAKAPRKRLIAAGAVAGVALVASACGSSTKSSSSPTTVSSSASSTAAPASTSAKFLGCMVTDTGGINDHSFNETSWEGMQAAAAANPNITVKYLQSTSSSDYVPNIQAFEKQNCGIIVTVGFDMATATKQAATADPSQKFAIVDNKYTHQLPNLLGISYETNQDAFLGGYLAAAMSKSGVVGTFGGQNIPTVTIYMSGWVAGVRYYNQLNHANVKVLGWDPNTNQGTFTGSFTDQAQGKLVTENMMSNGADIIFPVAGGVGLGAAAAVQAAGPPHYMEWVDTDGCVSASQYCSIFITSVTKGLFNSVRDVVESAANGTFKGGTYVGTLANGGVGLAPYHDFASKIPASVQSEITKLKAGIEAGTISVDPLKYPAS